MGRRMSLPVRILIRLLADMLGIKSRSLPRFRRFPRRSSRLTKRKFFLDMYRLIVGRRK